MTSKILYILSFLVLLTYEAKPQVLEIYEESKEAIETAILKNINRTEQRMAVEKQVNNTQEIIKLEAQKEFGEKQLEVTEKIYEHYKKVVESVETVSSSIRSYKKLEEFYQNIGKILSLYSKYGVALTFYSLYDFDDYINPESHDAYMMAIRECYSKALELSGKMSVIVFSGQQGVKASDYERMKTIKEFCKESEDLLYAMNRIINSMINMIPIKKYSQETNIELKKSFYDYETYAR